MAELELEDVDSEAPDVAGTAIVVPTVEFGVDALGAHCRQPCQPRSWVPVVWEGTRLTQKSEISTCLPEFTRKWCAYYQSRQVNYHIRNSLMRAHSHWRANKHTPIHPLEILPQTLKVYPPHRSHQFHQQIEKISQHPNIACRVLCLELQ